MNKSIKIAMNILARYQYVYDPDHNSKPNGMWKRTTSGWSTNDGEDGDETHVTQSKPSSTTSTPVRSHAPEQLPDDLTDDMGDHADSSPTTPHAQVPANEEEKQQEEPAKETTEFVDEEEPVDNNDDNLFDEDGSDDDFTLDKDGKDEEEAATENEPEEPLPGDAEQKEDADDGLFDEANKDNYIDPDKYDDYIEQMNAFIERFDESEGKENDITFKAIASNLDWDSLEEVKAFSQHCAKKELEGADEVIAFLYFQHQEDAEKFSKLVADMK